MSSFARSLLSLLWSASVVRFERRGLSHVVGVVLFAALAVAAWVVGLRMIRLQAEGSGKLALAGVPVDRCRTAIISLLWVGIGPPFQATLSENYMRFLVLVWNSILVTIGFVVLKDALHEAGERFYSTVGFAAALPAGAAYLICLNLSLAQVAMALHGDKTPLPAILGDFYSAIEFVACVMTYAATAMFATAMSRVRLLGRSPALGYVTASATPRAADPNEGPRVSRDLRQHRTVVHAGRA